MHEMSGPPVTRRYVPPNAATTVPTAWAYVALQMTPADRPWGTEWRWGGAAVTFAGQVSTSAPAAGAGAVWCERPADLWAEVDVAHDHQHKLVVVCDQGDELLRVAEPVRELGRLGYTLDDLHLTRGRTRALFRAGRKRVEVVDLRSWLPVGDVELHRLAAWAGQGGPMWRTGPDGAPDDCAARSGAMRAVCGHLWDWWAANDCGHWRATGAGAAWATWRHRFMPVKVVCHDHAPLRSLERAAVYSGRSEAWRFGRQPAGPVAEWDQASCYARVCRDVELPTAPRGTAGRVRLTDALWPRSGRRHLVEASVSTTRPVVPWRDAEGVCWPVGTFSGVWWDCELAELVDAGGSVKVRRVHVYGAAPALRDWAEWVLALVEPPYEAAGPIVAAAAKHWGRALVGRFGARYRQWEPVGEPMGEPMTVRRVVDHDTGARTEMLVLPGRTLVDLGHQDAPLSSPALMGAVMAEARVRLWRAMGVAGLGELVHVDTDGMLVTAAGAGAVEAAGLDGWRHKADWAGLEVIGSRRLVGARLVRMPGIPRTAARVAPRVWEGSVRESVEASLRAGWSASVPDRSRRWQIGERETRRVRCKDGTSASVEVVEDERYS